ncbi:MAG: hypothetical protein LBT84_04790 [Spirochaetia bacterium]|jgi:hypothetical protein|nr:hypothetical protein [Spirochaetia bacterium]
MRRLYTLIFAGLLLSCSHGGVEYRETPLPGMRVDVVRGTAVIRNVYAELSLRQIPPSELKKILKSLPAKKGSFRLPRLLFFMVSAKNTGDFPLFLTGGKAVYKNENHAAVKTDEFREKFTSPMYNAFDFDKLTSARRLLPYGYNKPDFPEDSIDYRLDFILPGETVVTIMAFDYPPPEVRRYALEFTVKTRGMPGTFGFDIARFEYRTEGGDFIRKGDISEDFL